MDVKFHYGVTNGILCICGYMTRDEVIGYMRRSPDMKIKWSEFYMIGGKHDKSRNGRSRNEYEKQQKRKRDKAHDHLVDAILSGRNIIWG